jgi:hypothetical protein
MADGLLALIGGKPGKSKDSEESSGEPKSAKARALKSMYSAMKGGDFDAAAKAFQDAYDECAMAHGDEETESEDDSLLSDEEE